MNDQVRVRYAPSPTGHLHIGGARTALFNYLFARSKQGKFIVRFEDTDQTRHIETGVDNQLNGLRWLGVDWDESVDVDGGYGPYRQMERLDLYKPFVERLLAEGNAYYCYCTEAELEQERSEQEARGETPRYSGRCRHLTPEQAEAYRAEGRRPTVRFRVPEDRMIRFEDEVRGEVEFDSNGIGDFIIARPDGIPMYNFAVVLDDHLMAITHVIRGEEHLSNTPRQVMLYEALDLPTPRFAHLSIILNPDRKKMSKRDESIVQFIEQYKDLGYLPEAVLNFITLLGWSPRGEEEIFTKEELIGQFGLDRVSKSPAVFDMDKLNWMNNQYIKKADPARIAELAIPHLQKAGRLPQTLSEAEQSWASRLVALYQEQLTYASEIVDLSALFFQEEVELEEEAKPILAEEQVPVVLGRFLELVRESVTLNPEDVQAMLKQVQKDTGFKGKQLFMPTRVALTGQMHGRDLNQTISLLGKEKAVARLERLLS
ncbi:glutamate--tRNA ligase [Paenibacillus aurantius]|uniref:Glutamate--tRNA ligase n=1 Tax=Paenibacillus aurantius TaxID=2918900 RepID=A0AA96LGU1_9BACL|nr:glutamate--tRNA ligase [Paenibacillus aurantius]WNQ11716.1 glutamate--tRNA ligase [Paenibacillus aurantius]